MPEERDSRVSGATQCPSSRWRFFLAPVGLIVGLRYGLFAPVGMLLWPTTANRTAEGVVLYHLLLAMIIAAVSLVALHRLLKEEGRGPDLWRVAGLSRITHSATVCALVLGSFIAACLVIAARADSISQPDSRTLFPLFLSSTRGRFCLSLLLLLLPAPEEIHVRGFFFVFLRAKMSALGAILCTLLWVVPDLFPAFVMYWHWVGWPIILAMILKQLILTLQRSITNSLVPCLITHSACNLLLFSAIWCG